MVTVACERKHDCELFSFSFCHIFIEEGVSLHLDLRKSEENKCRQILKQRPRIFSVINESKEIGKGNEILKVVHALV